MFTYEFEVAVKSFLLCGWRGHKEPKRYETTYWAPGHLGAPTKFCKRCGKVLKTRSLFMQMDKKSKEFWKKQGWTTKDFKRGYKLSTNK